ncbi:MAG: hypothetical protein U1D68_02895 [Arthrobacter sp.]|nr:hypothetical protein [Arthrobacter sp.]MDZ4353701.1 hypothetical protein [Arthrobacter sp.]
MSTTNTSNNAGGSGASAGTLLASDAAACASRSSEVQQLAARVGACAEHTDAVLARLVRVELQGWQSPAGRAYRTAVSLQAASLRRSRAALQEAAVAVYRHAQNVALSPGRPGP